MQKKGIQSHGLHGLGVEGKRSPSFLPLPGLPNHRQPHTKLPSHPLVARSLHSPRVPHSELSGHPPSARPPGPTPQKPAAPCPQPPPSAYRHQRGPQQRLPGAPPPPAAPRQPPARVWGGEHKRWVAALHFTGAGWVRKVNRLPIRPAVLLLSTSHPAFLLQPLALPPQGQHSDSPA